LRANCALKIRDAGFDDVREIQRVARITWDHTYRETIPESVRRKFVGQAYSADSLRHRMESNVFIVAMMGEEILGFADFRRLSETSVELAAIYVLPGMQGRGIGSRLLESGTGRFPPLTKFMLRVERDNTRALNFYEAHGFRRTREHAEEFYGHVVHETEMILGSPETAL
jgi:ribosomal protein S18 acetylase RimI-like enzyme